MTCKWLSSYPLDFCFLNNRFLDCNYPHSLSCFFSFPLHIKTYFEGHQGWIALMIYVLTNSDRNDLCKFHEMYSCIHAIPIITKIWSCHFHNNKNLIIIKFFVHAFLLPRDTTSLNDNPFEWILYRKCVNYNHDLYSITKMFN